MAIRSRIAFIVISAISLVGAENLTIHLLNPWAKNTVYADSLYIISNEPGWWPGALMSMESCNWYSYTFQSTPRTDNSQRIEFMWGNPSGNHFNYSKGITGTGQLFMSQIFGNQPTTVTDVWMTIPDTTKGPVLSYSPPSGKNVRFLQPWDFGAAMMQAQGGGFVRMQMDTGSNRCGWFSYPYYCGYDSARVKFMNSIDSSYFSASGLGDGAFIDLSAVFKTSDTAWIIPDPVTGRAAVSPKFPGQTAACARELNLAATLRNYSENHPDFGGFATGGKNGAKTGCWTGADGYWSAIHGMMSPQLDTGKMVPSPTNPCPIDSFNWFTTLPLKGYTNAMCYNLNLVKNSDGYYEYDNPYFFVADSFRWLDPNHTVANPWYSQIAGNDNLMHNMFFTIELKAYFQYQKGQTFYFRGDDDVWVYINNKLVVDLGGIHNPLDGSVKLDTLGLTVGSLDSLKLFYCSRNAPGSNFRMVTSINLQTSTSLFSTQTPLPGGAKRYDIFQKIFKSSLACGESGAVVDTQTAKSDFYIVGPQLNKQLTTGLNYGGITIKGDSSVVLDTTALTGLQPGAYTIRYFLRSDHSQSGAIPFTVRALPADHVDLLVDSVKLDSTKDAKVDSIVISMFDSAAGAYAVLRDSTQKYLGKATNPVWTVRDPTVVTVTRSTTDSSGCILTKVKAGRTWLVVNQAPDLKPDSTLVIVYIKPAYPIIQSAIMLDNNADLIPDTLRIALTDTFKTGQRLDSVAIVYRGQRYSLAAAAVNISGKTVVVPFASLSGVDGRPTGQVTIFMTVDSGVKSDSSAFTDGVGPALIAADVLENDGTQPDVLFLDFSEPVVSSSLVGSQLLLMPAGTNDTVLLTVTQATATLNDSVFTVQISPANRKVLSGDRLRLLPGSAGGVIEDLGPGNKPHTLNRSVAVGFRIGAALISSSWYIDGNADGVIDTIIVRFKRKVQSSEVKDLTVQWNFNYTTLPGGVMVKRDDSTFAVPIAGAVTSLNAIVTSGAMDISIEYIAFPNVLRSSPVVDSAGPVIVSANFFPGVSVGGAARASDTIQVMFSEAIQSPSLRPFLLSARSGGVHYDFFLNAPGSSVDSKTWRYTINAIEPLNAVAYPMQGDSIWLNPVAAVSDIGGNKQLNPLNHRVLLVVTWPKSDWDVTVVPNPFTQNDDVIPTKLVQQFNIPAGHGTLITANKNAPYDVVQSSGTIAIYDALGNSIVNETMKLVNGVFYYYWNGQNRSMRHVGTGAYLVIVKITEENKQTYVKKIMVGVKR